MESHAGTSNNDSIAPEIFCEQTRNKVKKPNGISCTDPYQQTSKGASGEGIDNELKNIVNACNQNSVLNHLSFPCLSKTSSEFRNHYSILSKDFKNWSAYRVKFIQKLGDSSQTLHTGSKCSTVCVFACSSVSIAASLAECFLESCNYYSRIRSAAVALGLITIFYVSKTSQKIYKDFKERVRKDKEKMNLDQWFAPSENLKVAVGKHLPFKSHQVVLDTIKKFEAIENEWKPIFQECSQEVTGVTFLLVDELNKEDSVLFRILTESHPIYLEGGKFFLEYAMQTVIRKTDGKDFYEDFVIPLFFSIRIASNGLSLIRSYQGCIGQAEFKPSKLLKDLQTNYEKELRAMTAIVEKLNPEPQ